MRTAEAVIAKSPGLFRAAKVGSQELLPLPVTLNL